MGDSSKRISLVGVREYLSEYPVELSSEQEISNQIINRTTLVTKSKGHVAYVDLLDLLFWLKKNKPELLEFVRKNKEDLESETLIVKVKNPNRKYPNKVFTATATHNLKRVPKKIEVLANKKGQIITYTENKNFNDPNTLLNNFKLIKADKYKVELTYGYLNEFGINETIPLTVRVW